MRFKTDETCRKNGPLALDAAGDRRVADFDFWTVADTGTRIGWVRTASYVSGRLVR